VRVKAARDDGTVVVEGAISLWVTGDSADIAVAEVRTSS